jgi:phytol kinase
VGSRWGRHRYRVPSLAGVPAERSLEGSAAVFFAGTVAAGVALLLQETDAASPALGAAALGAGLAGAVVEAVSPHGTDNLTVPLAAATTARLLLG